TARTKRLNRSDGLRWVVALGVADGAGFGEEASFGDVFAASVVGDVVRGEDVPPEAAPGDAVSDDAVSGDDVPGADVTRGDVCGDASAGGDAAGDAAREVVGKAVMSVRTRPC